MNFVDTSSFFARSKNRVYLESIIDLLIDIYVDAFLTYHLPTLCHLHEENFGEVVRIGSQHFIGWLTLIQWCEVILGLDCDWPTEVFFHLYVTSGPFYYQSTKSRGATVVVQWKWLNSMQSISNFGFLLNIKKLLFIKVIRFW